MLASLLRHRRLALILGLGLAAAPVLAKPIDQVRVRVAGYKQLGAAFKAVNDALRKDDLQPAKMKQSAATIVAASRNQYKWFPAGSGPQPGVKTDAKHEIWSDAKAFRARQDAFARQAAAFQRVALTGDAARIKLEARKLGATCKGCHDTFRVEDD